MGALGTVPKSLEKGLRRKKSEEDRDHSDNSIAEIGKNTDKSPGDQKRLAVTQTLVKVHQLILV